MQCPCGGTTAVSITKIKTAQKAMEWCKGAVPRNLPVVVEQDKCPDCGRMAYKVYDGKKVIYSQG